MSESSELKSATEMFEGGSMSVATAVQQFGVSRSVLYQMMSSGQLPYSQIGRKRVIARRALAALLARTVIGFPSATGAK